MNVFSVKFTYWYYYYTYSRVKCVLNSFLIPPRFEQHDLLRISLVYISDCYEGDILLAHYHKVFGPAINHACTAPKLPLSNYSPRELGWKPVAQITVHVASHLARMIIISHRRNRKINRSSSDDGENSRDCPRQADNPVQLRTRSLSDFGTLRWPD